MGIQKRGHEKELLYKLNCLMCQLQMKNKVYKGLFCI